MCSGIVIWSKLHILSSIYYKLETLAARLIVVRAQSFQSTRPILLTVRGAIAHTVPPAVSGPCPRPSALDASSACRARRTMRYHPQGSAQLSDAPVHNSRTHGLSACRASLRTCVQERDRSRPALDRLAAAILCLAVAPLALPSLRGRAQAGRHPDRRRRRGPAPPQPRRAVGCPDRSRRSALRRAGAGQRQVRTPTLSGRALGDLRGRTELHLPPQPERPLPRRQADHVGRRRLFARRRQGEPPLRDRHVRCGGQGGYPRPLHRGDPAEQAPPGAHAIARAAPFAGHPQARLRRRPRSQDPPHECHAGRLRPFQVQGVGEGPARDPRAQRRLLHRGTPIARPDRRQIHQGAVGAHARAGEGRSRLLPVRGPALPRHPEDCEQPRSPREYEGLRGARTGQLRRVQLA